MAAITTTKTAAAPKGAHAHAHGKGRDDTADMVEEIAVAVAAGLVPIVGQAINVYDTIDCLIRLRNSTTPAEKMEAKFDLVLALIGWIPGAGGGVKKTMRIVNKQPERYAPIMFDVLRMVLAKLDIQTSPEVLLDQLFDAKALQQVLVTVRLAIEESWLYEQMPADAQRTLSLGMQVVGSELPGMVRHVATKLTKWKSKQRNNAAEKTSLEKKSPTDVKPDKLDKATGTGGESSGTKGTSGGVVNARAGTIDLTKFTKEVTGILGEHISDYFCLKTYGWGTDWSAHDLGTEGNWKVKPGKIQPGKISEKTKLNKLFQGKAHGTGLDGVWKVDPGNPHNRAKPYAVVESKASVVCDVPLGLDKPKIEHKLGDNRDRPKKPAAEPEAAPVQAENTEKLLEPDTCDLPMGVAASAAPAEPADGKKPPAPPPPKAPSTAAPAKVSLAKAPAGAPLRPKPKGRGNRNKPPRKPKKPKVLRVQMSHVWITMNMPRAVGVLLAIDVLKDGYSRHLLYTPFYLASSAQHVKAFALGVSDHHEFHTNHEIDENHRYDEDDIMAAVNLKNFKLGLPLETSD